ncbi:cytochrome P450 [Archangium lansingense]|uniref:Cytochrome P450 n=1 Tax=Archangium lansingense TaxID=2995310 RepID=A0ABT4A3C2_9BACT|nr:cytochrome P450 [Archangium lansinium]MCY1076145.1 cytochrome P450 [Archangium lansinium]
MSSRVNLLAPEVRMNPYPLYAELRRNAPVSQVDPGGLWAVARYADVLTVMKNPQLFSSEGIRRTYRPEWISDYPMADSMLVMDPPHHTRLRALVSRAFGTSVLTRLEPRVRELAQQVTAALPQDRSVDFVDEFSIRVPIAVLGDLVGIPPSLHARLKRWAEVMTQFTSVRPEDTELQERLRAAVADARAHFEEVVEERRRAPREDLVSDLLRARVDGEALTPTDLMGFMFLLLIGGLETTVHLLSSCALKFQEDPALMARLRAEPALIPRFIDEMLRHSGPVHGVVRLVTDEVELGGVHVPQGARLLLLMASANRDEAHFPDPDRFDLDRPGPQNLPFGHGAHFCLGAQLARMESRLALEALLARFSRLTLGEEPARWNISLVMRGPTLLPLAAHTD